MSENGIGYVGIDKDYFVSVKEVLNITAETGAVETQDRVRNLPPADVVEVRHGYWFKDEKFYHDIMVDGNPVCLFHTCSVCGVADEYITVNERPDGRHAIVRSIRKYCPNCGARMEREWGGANENKNN